MFKPNETITDDVEMMSNITGLSPNDIQYMAVEMANKHGKCLFCRVKSMCPKYDKKSGKGYCNIEI